MKGLSFYENIEYWVYANWPCGWISIHTLDFMLSPLLNSIGNNNSRITIRNNTSQSITIHKKSLHSVYLYSYLNVLRMRRNSYFLFVSLCVRYHAVAALWTFVCILWSLLHSRTVNVQKTLDHLRLRIQNIKYEVTVVSFILLKNGKKCDVKLRWWNYVLCI